MTKSTEAIITDLIEGYEAIGGKWVRLAEIARLKNLTAAEIAEGVRDLMGDDDFRASPDPLGGMRLTDEDRAYGPVIGGEQLHQIAWY